jgi:predicted dehydrogenase
MNKGLVIGAISSHGHERGHVGVLDQLAEELFGAFFLAVQTGAPAPAPIEDAVHMLEIIEAAKESSATGRAVRIQESSQF